MELVSAIITTHNRRELLRRAIDSVFCQTYPLIELIVVDDHSDDGTNEICKDSRINYIYISKEESRGGNYARNLGIKASKGMYCAFLDDDDYWLPSKIEKQVNLINEKGCGLVFCGRTLEIINDDSIKYKDIIPNKSQQGNMSKKILYSICTTTSCMLLRRQLLFQIGLFDEKLRFWQEYEMSIRIAQVSNFCFVNDCLTMYRVDNKDKNRLTNKYYEWRASVRYIHNKHEKLYKQLDFAKQYLVRNLVWDDARGRCKSSGFYGRYLMYELLFLPCRVFRKFKSIFNR